LPQAGRWGFLAQKKRQDRRCFVQSGEFPDTLLTLRGQMGFKLFSVAGIEPSEYIRDTKLELCVSFFWFAGHWASAADIWRSF
jgi:hypothetical protein